MGYTTALGHTPAFTIAKDGDDITGRFDDRLISIRVCSYEGDGEVDTVDIEVDDRDWSIPEPSIGEGSATLQVSLGYSEGALYEMGTFQIDEIHHKWIPKTMLLHGNSVGATTNLKSSTVTQYFDKTLAEIIGEIAITAGVKASVDAGLGQFKIPYLAQYSSYGTLLAELERRFDGLAKFSDGYLSFTKRGTGLNASGHAMDVVTLYPEDTSGESDIKSNNYFAYSKVRVAYVDGVRNQQVWVESTLKGSPNSTVPTMLSQTFLDKEQAQAAANAHMARLNRSTKDGTVTLSKGAPELRGGSKVILSGFRSGIDDEYMIRCATHTFTKDGGIGTVLSVYSEGGAGAADSSSSTDEAPTTAPSLDEMAPEPSTAPADGPTGTLGHE